MSKGAKTANDGVRDGQNGGEEGQGREKSHEWSLSPSLSVRKWSLVTLSGKGWTKRLFSGGSSSQCEALRAFSTLLGHFGVILGPYRSF